jgi:hypothetical protein
MGLLKEHLQLRAAPNTSFLATWASGGIDLSIENNA